MFQTKLGGKGYGIIAICFLSGWEEDLLFHLYVREQSRSELMIAIHLDVVDIFSCCIEERLHPAMIVGKKFVYRFVHGLVFYLYG